VILFQKIICVGYNLSTVPEITCKVIKTQFLQLAQLLQRDCAAAWVSFGQKWNTGTVREYFVDITGLSSTTVT